MKMAIISGTIKAESIDKSAGGSIVINTVDPEQLDRIERKMDRVLELSENKELSIKLDGEKIAKDVNPIYPFEFHSRRTE